VIPLLRRRDGPCQVPISTVSDPKLPCGPRRRPAVHSALGVIAWVKGWHGLRLAEPVRSFCAFSSPMGIRCGLYWSCRDREAPMSCRPADTCGGQWELSQRRHTVAVGSRMNDTGRCVRRIIGRELHNKAELQVVPLGYRVRWAVSGEEGSCLLQEQYLADGGKVRGRRVHIMVQVGLGRAAAFEPPIW
jgi:hypothetical protein